MSYINHITLGSGHNRRSPSSEVPADVVAWLRPWLDKLLAGGVPLPLPEPSLAQYSAAAHIEQGGLVMTVYSGADALVTFAVAGRSRQSAPLWAYVTAQHGAVPGLGPPAVPWLAVAVRDPSRVLRTGASDWLGDFERCVAWTFLEK